MTDMDTPKPLTPEQEKITAENYENLKNKCILLVPQARQKLIDVSSKIGYGETVLNKVSDNKLKETIGKIDMVVNHLKRRYPYAFNPEKTNANQN
jgi:hypothetical protein